MEIGIIGLPQSGKSTLFEIMTGIKSREMFGEPSVRGVAKVPDARFDELVTIFKPKKATPASIPFIDIAAAGDNPWDGIRKELSNADGLIHIIDGFTSLDEAKILKAYRKLADELVISDLVAIENKLGRISKMPATALKGDEAILAVCLPRAKDALEAGKPLRAIEFKPEEIRVLRGFTFWTMRPELIVINTGEGGTFPADEFTAKNGIDSPVVTICCQVEAEIAELEAAERMEFLASLGIAEPAFERIIRRSFELLGRMCYFTVGEDEVRAWEISNNSTAPRAAAAIHKDFERGFIKAEVVSYDDFMTHGKSISGAKSAGRFRLEGKEYIVKDADIISFRFNV